MFYTVTHIIKAKPVPAVEHSRNKVADSTDYIKLRRYLLEVVIWTFKFSLKQVSFSSVHVNSYSKCINRYTCMCSM